MTNKKILMVTSECAPFAKTGGLADVVGSLPSHLNELGADCRVIMPLYSQVKEKYGQGLEFIRWSTIRMGWRSVYNGVFHLKHEGVDYYFIDNEYYFNTGTIYTDYSFDIERFSYFQRGVLDVLGDAIDFWPDIIHCHDWQAAMIPCLLSAHFKPYGYFENVKTVLTIHNLKYQGIHGVEQILDYMDLPSEYMTEYGVLKDGVPNFLKAGIVYADYITTVSPTYAKEIFMPYYGEGLDHVLRNYSYKIRGILNGIDIDEWNPETDQNIEAQYDSKTYQEGKQKNKLAMQEAMDLEQNAKIPMITMVTRLVEQKGLDLILHVLDEILALNCQVLILGTGDGIYEQKLFGMERRHPDRMRSLIMYSNDLSHRLYAAGDVFLMPSLFEPCGLSQMISMRYGNVPLVRETGGLRDTVTPYNIETGEGNGFSFPNVNAHDMLFLLKDAIRIYNESPDHWHNIVQNGMARDFSWELSAKEYIEMYNNL